MSFTVELRPAGVTLKVNAGTPFVDVLHEYGVEFPCGGAGACGSCKVRLIKGNVQTSEQHAAALRKNGLDGSWRLACMSSVTDNLILDVAQWEHPVLSDSAPFEFAPQSGYGIAVDLGSTTIVSQLLNLRNGRVAAVQQGLNPQAAYGADVMSRIAFALKQPSNAEKLCSTVRKAVYGQVRELLKSAPGLELKAVKIVGNTVMHHTFCGVSLAPLSAFPFLTPHNGQAVFAPHQLGWELPQSAEVHFLPNLGSFVGSDILAGILSSRMYEKEQYSVLVDLGTNGEIAVGSCRRIFCASTSAGPAFEGASISCGMVASTGAIASLKRSARGALRVRVIGNVAARGICGSGLIDAAALLVASGDVERQGALSNDKTHIPLAKNVSLTWRDVRELQLAKSAIATGVAILMKRLNITKRDVGAVYLAGGFGAYVNVRNAIAIGLLEFDEAQVVKLGNSALTGAKMLLFDDGTLAEKVRKITRHVALETDPNFQDMFCQKLEFP
jgi:uncharacterized 2Fe-2S/4Fe-4S cluster protein (DUF4445 family)